MWLITTNLPRLRLVDPNYTKTLDRRMGQIIREAAREWLRAVLKSVPRRGGFPVVTGAAISTLKPLGRILRVAINNSPRAGLDGRYRGDRRSLGEGSQEFHIIDKGPEYSFDWATSLLHYYINEFYGTPPHPEWNSTSDGEDAFMAYVNQALKRIPGIELEFGL